VLEDLERRIDGETIDSKVEGRVAIDEGVTIERSEVEHSILLSGVTVTDLDARLEASLLGRNVKLMRGAGMPAVPHRGFEESRL